MPWRNRYELRQDKQSYEDRYKEVWGDILCNVKRHEPYLDVDYEELQSFSFLQTDEEGDNGEFSVINPDLLHLDLLNNYCLSNALVRSTTTDNILHPNEQFYEIYSQLNESQQRQLNFNFKLAKKNNELPPKTFQIFLSGGAEVEQSFLVTAINEYLRKVLG